MAGITHNVMRLLLFSFIRTGVNGQDSITSPDHGYSITFPCEENLVCFHVWHLSASETSDNIAIVSNGQIQTIESESQDPQCTLQINDLTAENVGSHRCQQRLDDFSPENTMPELNIIPGKMVTLQCILLTYVEQGRCITQLRRVSLMWVDEFGAEIQEGSQYQIRQKSSCDVTLTVTFQSQENKKFRCQATVDEQVMTSVELQVRVPAFKGRGRGLIIELQPENQGGTTSQPGIGAGVGVVGCVVVTALVVVFIVNRRRTRNQLPDESSCYTASTNNVTNADDVIYADIILPDGPDNVRIHHRETTEYACVRYK